MKKNILKWLTPVLALVFCLGLAACGGKEEAVDPEAANYEVTDGVITKYVGPGGDVTIPATISGKEITAIGEKAFYNNTDVTSVTISEGIREIGASAFESCRIEKLDLGSVEKIGANAFTYSELMELTIPESVKELGDGCFSYVQYRESDGDGKLIIPASITSIPAKAFCGTKFTSIEFLSETLPELGEEAFGQVTAVQIILPDSVTPEQVPEYREKLVAAGMSDRENLVTFWNTKGEELVIVYADYSQIFRYNDQLGYIIEYIGEDANVTVPAEINGYPITTIGQDAFSGNENVKSVTISEGLAVIENGAFEGCTNLESISIREGITSIGGHAFESCSKLESVVLPDSLISLGEYAFFECRALKDVTLSAGLVELPGYVFAECNALESISLPASVTTLGNGAFQNCTSLSSINLENVASLGCNCFQATAFTEITIPGSVKAIPDQCFWLCQYLTEITVEDGVESIGEMAFANCGREEAKQVGPWIYFSDDPSENPYLYPEEEQANYYSFINVYLPGSIQTVSGYFLENCHVDGLYLLDVTSVEEMPEFAQNAFSSMSYISQVYFTEETINACGAELDQFLMGLDNMKDVAWYFENRHPYWASEAYE